MNPRALVLLVGLLISARSVIAAGFTVEQYKTFDGVVGTTISGLNEDTANIDGLLKALGDSFDHSSYGRDPGSQGIRQSMAAEAVRIKEAITRLNRELAELRVRDNNPAVMIYVLSREQAVSFALYKWCRSITEITDLANASIRRNDPVGAQLCTLLMHEGEAQQDTIATALQSIASTALELPTP